jgi:hypothetical protein
MDVEKFVRHLCRLVLRHQMPVWNYFVNSFYSVMKTLKIKNFSKCSFQYVDLCSSLNSNLH